MREYPPIDLPRDFHGLGMKEDFLTVLLRRKSSRVYTQENMSLLQLSFLLWATQGVKEIRGKSYATLRTAPCGGARHPFETYLLVKKVDGLTPGAYHYLPMTHQLELLKPMENEEALTGLMDRSLCGQTWAAKSNVVFYWSLVPYRSEWRYGIYAHRMIMADMGHVGKTSIWPALPWAWVPAASALMTRPCATALLSWTEKRSSPSIRKAWAPSGWKTRRRRRTFYRFVEEEGL